MNWLSGISSKEKEDMFQDSCVAYNSGVINEKEFRMTLGKLGYNATDIEDVVKQHRPEPPENANGETD